MSRIKTYILAPNFTLTDGPDSPYHPWLGTIIADPLRPTTRVLDKLLVPLQKTVTVRESDVVHSQTSSRSFNASLFANFLGGAASASVGGQRSRESTSVYKPVDGTLETRYFEPSDVEVRERVEASAKVRAAMSAGLTGRTPVFMITGIKVAKGLKVESSSATKFGGNVGGLGPVAAAPAVSLGAQVGGEWGREVHVVAEKGWREKNRRVETEVYASKQAFLGQDGGSEDEDEQLGASAMTGKDLAELEETADAVTNLKAVEMEGDASGEKCICIMPIVEDGEE